VTGTTTGGVGTVGVLGKGDAVGCWVPAIVV
jgi:hypothetical protein